jgi:hypothetical protein
VPNLHLALGLGAITVFGLVWLSYDMFYRGLGVSPAEVGITYADVITKAVMTMLLFVPMICFVAFIVSRRVPHATTFAVACWVVIVYIPIMSVGWAVVGAYTFPNHPLIFATAALILLGLPTIYFTSRGWNARLADLARRTTFAVPSQRGGLASSADGARFHMMQVAAFPLIGTILLAALFGASVSQHVARGDLLAVPYVVSPVYFPVGFACVTWIGTQQTRVIDPTKPLLLLGHADGEFVFYRMHDGKSVEGPIHVPMNQVIVAISTSKTVKCM